MSPGSLSHVTAQLSAENINSGNINVASRAVDTVSDCRPRSYKTFFMLNSADHEIFSANKYENTIVGTFIFISR